MPCWLDPCDTDKHTNTHTKQTPKTKTKHIYKGFKSTRARDLCFLPHSHLCPLFWEVHEHLCSFLPHKFRLWLWILKEPTGTGIWNWAGHLRMNCKFKQKTQWALTQTHLWLLSLGRGRRGWVHQWIDRTSLLWAAVKKSWCHRHTVLYSQRGWRIIRLLHQQPYPEKQ